MSSGNKDFDRFMGAKARMELDPDLRHECNGQHEGTIDYHHPLTRAQVKLLLTVALATNNVADERVAVQTRARISARLVQAIKGHKCPHEAEGFVSDVQMVLEHFYTHGVRADMPLNDLVKQIMSILANEKPSLGTVSHEACRRYNLAAEQVQFVKVWAFWDTYAATAIRYTNVGHRRLSNLNKTLPIGDDGIIEKKAA